jgi:glucokinase
MHTAGTIIGIDLGGTKTAVALFDASSMKQLSVSVFPTEAVRGFKAVYGTLRRAITDIRREDTHAIGLGVPGVIDQTSKAIVTLPNIPGAEGIELAARIQYETHLPTVVENDARCFAYAEALQGAGKGHSIVLGVTLGTGVGGGIVIEGKLYRGARGYAGEVGHMLLQPGRPPYPTDDERGEVEQFLSGTAMGKRCEAASSPEDYLEGQVCGFMQPEVFREVAWLIVNAMHSIDPAIIIFGGSAGRALAPHLPVILAEASRWLLPRTPPPELAIGILPDAAALGAALLTRNDETS